MQAYDWTVLSMCDRAKINQSQRIRNFKTGYPFPFVQLHGLDLAYARCFQSRYSTLHFYLPLISRTP